MPLQPGSQFGRYELVSRIGHGGMAETYRARLMGEAGVTKPVLIKKVLPEYASDQAFTSMFISEARISATLSHGNIAQVYDFGRVDGEYFLAMEFVDGQPLHKLLKRALHSGMTSIPVPLAAFIGIELCRGLHYAHTRSDQAGKPLGIVHRDISPDNVLISYEGQVKIVDFGIAKARELRGFNTEPGVVKGKFLFFSPEQARGEEVDARTDVWATGIVLYELLCGQLPVRGPHHAAMPKLVEGRFPRPRQINPDLPPELDDIVMRALEVDRDKRIESSHELGDALAEFLYSTEPRFSALSLAHFVKELFREDLTAEGRSVQVPRSFLEQMARWQGATVPASAVQTALPTAPPLPRAASMPKKAEPASVSESKLIYLGVGAGAALTVLILALLFVTLGGPSVQATADPSAPKPLGVQKPAPSTAPAPRAPEPQVARPEPSSRQPPSTPPAPTKPPIASASAKEQARAAFSDGSKLLRARQYREALTRAARCLELDPSYPECEMILGASYAGLYQWEEAAKHYRRFLEMAPDHRVAPKIRQALESYENSKSH